ncbi:AAA family ATPase [Shewanella youngdeokensis]|uniref:MoxR family ATPase n=1 Tax=Shewanella youngdeokensis TaxID=2999068 RepID=A0ABZ0K2L6_9GAMM|nr:MoxR family ATPase [Shewanella sp. DAU334]
MGNSVNSSQKAVSTLYASVCKSVVGQEHVVKSLIIALLTRGHVLLEGLPGTAKTRSIKSLADSMQASFGRVQFTPDLLPSDVTGAEVYREVAGKPQLDFQPGPIFNNLVLADEINRAPAKVQAALLEAMAEGTVTSAGKSRKLPELFLVLATQNPVDQEGTYPLPEAQMDRFTLKVNVDYPDRVAELAIIQLVRREEKASQFTTEELSEQDDEQGCTVTPADIINGQRELADIHVSPVMENYIVDLVMATRKADEYSNASFVNWIEIGASPRASIALDRCARANAWLDGRDFVDPDDVRSVLHSVLGHRLSLSYDAVAQGVKPEQVVDDLLKHVAFGM